MEDQLMFNINAMDINHPVARVYDAERRVRCEITLGNSVHLWHMDLLLSAYRLYWTGVGIRDASLNAVDGITYIYPEDGRDRSEDMKSLAKAIIDRVCQNKNPDRPRLLEKMDKNRFVLLTRNPANNTEIFTSGGYDSPYFFTRRHGDSLGRFDTFEKAFAAK
jgi:hypothetical protein